MFLPPPFYGVFSFFLFSYCINIFLKNTEFIHANNGNPKIKNTGTKIGIKRIKKYTRTTDKMSSASIPRVNGRWRIDIRRAWTMVFCQVFSKRESNGHTYKKTKSHKSINASVTPLKTKRRRVLFINTAEKNR